MKINPFNPNSPTGPGMFAGRFIEIEAIEQILLQTKANKGHGFLLLGQRGIGKTSLLNFPLLSAITSLNQLPLNPLLCQRPTAHNSHH